MVTHAISEYWWGLGINIPEGLSAIGLAALRHGLSGTKATPDKPEVQVIELTPVSSFQYIPQTSSLLQSLESAFYGTLASRDPKEGVNRPKRLPDGWRHGVSHPFTWGDKVWDKGETPQDSLKLFNQLTQQILMTEMSS